MKQLRDHKAQGSALFTLVSGIVIVIAVIYFLIKLAGSGSFGDVAETTEAATQTRIQPVGQLKLGDGIPVGERQGDQIFNKICIQCHGADKSVPNAPKIENNGEWAPRIAQGFDTLFQHALNGFNAMPAKGGAADLTDQELKRVITYMANKSGGTFPDPDAAAPADAAASGEALQLRRLKVQLLQKPLKQMRPKQMTKVRQLQQPVAQTAKKFTKPTAKHVTAVQFQVFLM